MTDTDSQPISVSAIAELFRALGDPLRVRMFYLLVASGEPLCVCEIVDALDMPQYQVSRHMAVLKRVGLVDTRRDGTWVYHFATFPATLTAECWQELQASFLQALQLNQDRQRLQTRLKLREAGRCVIGLQGTCDC